MITTILNLEYDPNEMWYINTPDGRPDNNGYAAPFPVWWSHFKLKGSGYAIGETKIQGEWINKKLKKEYPNVSQIKTVDLEYADFNMDIIYKPLPNKADFIFCMAVLEHLIDPISAIRNMSDSLKIRGLLCISVPTQKFKQHRRPLDCYRFLEDAMKAFAVVGRLHLLDYTPCQREWCSIYRRL